MFHSFSLFYMCYNTYVQHCQEASANFINFLEPALNEKLTSTWNIITYPSQTNFANKTGPAATASTRRAKITLFLYHGIVIVSNSPQSTESQVFNAFKILVFACFNLITHIINGHPFHFLLFHTPRITYSKSKTPQETTSAYTITIFPNHPFIA